MSSMAHDLSRSCSIKSDNRLSLCGVDGYPELGALDAAAVRVLAARAFIAKTWAGDAAITRNPG